MKKNYKFILFLIGTIYLSSCGVVKNSGKYHEKNVSNTGIYTDILYADMEINEEESRVEVFLKHDEVSMAIGKVGHNIKLASRLTGLEIDVYREGAEDIDDVDLDEFTDEIDDWIIDELKAIGCDSAKSVLEIGKKDLVKRTDLEEETVDEIVKILSSEFEK